MPVVLVILLLHKVLAEHGVVDQLERGCRLLDQVGRLQVAARDELGETRDCQDAKMGRWVYGKMGPTENLRRQQRWRAAEVEAAVEAAVAAVMAAYASVGC